MQTSKLEPNYRIQPIKSSLGPSLLGNFDVRILPDHVQHPIHYFELFWDSEIWNTLVENTNAYAQYKEAECKEKKTGMLR